MATISVERLGRMWRTQKNLRAIARNSRRSWPSAAPVWPLPHQAGGPSDEEIRAEFAKYPLWHYAYRFEGGLDFAVRHVFQDPLADSPERPLQRFRHFMPWLLQATGGTLEGKRVLDVACNSGFWSIQCALLGAKEVVGFDARQELIDQANLIKRIVGVRNVDYRLLNLWEMTPDALGGTFDVVLTLGILYHLPKPVEALERTKAMSRDYVLLDTSVFAAKAPLIFLKWEEPYDILSAVAAGVSMVPSRRSVEMILKHLKFREWTEIPLRTTDMPDDYLRGDRASWLIRV